MSDYFEKLGNLLNDVLETGELPSENTADTSTAEDVTNATFKNNTQDSKQSESFKTEKNRKRIFTFNRKKTSNAQIIRNNQYTINQQLTAEIQSAFNLLGLIFPCTWKQVNKQYHFLLKEIHPDTKKSEHQNTDTQINDLQQAYNLLKQFYGK